MQVHDRFHQILKELGDLHNKKGHDYGREQDPYANVRASSEWGVKPWVGALIRATDKLRRLQTYAQKGTLANEGAIDSLKDLAVYAIISLVLLEESFGEDIGAADMCQPKLKRDPTIPPLDPPRVWVR